MSKLKYVPILRVRQEETKVLKSFDFEDGIYPCLEIVKEIDRKPAERKNPKQNTKPKKEKTFEEAYLPLVNGIKAKYVFVDLPVHLKPLPRMQEDTLRFLTTVVTIMSQRTKYIKKFIPLAHKVIPVISTYAEVSGERGTIATQESDLRKSFDILAFRTFPKTFFRDITQIATIVRPTDFIIMDWGEMVLDLTDGDQQDILVELKKIDCKIITHRNAFPLTLTNSGLDHGMVIKDIDNNLLNQYKDFEGHCFSDYSGIKKDNISGAPITSPGFMYYDAVQNNFYGYKYKNGGHKKGQKKPKLSEYETTIIPAVIASEATRRMKKSPLSFLGVRNIGWKIIKNIELGVFAGGESGQSPAKFKRIGVEHYLHCLRTRISNGDFK
jgi:hypothetical protein